MAKSIIDIEINDGPWKAFQAQVKQHQQILSKMPAQWGAVGQSVGKVTGAAAKMVAAIKETANQFKNADTHLGKMVVMLKTSDRLVSGLARNTLKVARNLQEATRSLLSWGSILGVVSGVLGAGGLFGIARMASTVSMGQASALQTGSTLGGAKAAEAAFGQLLGGPGGVQNLLSRMAKEKESGGLMFRRLGMTEQQFVGKAPTDILGPFLEALKSAYIKAPKGMEAKAMETLAPGLDFGLIKQLSQTNLSSLEAFYQTQKRQLDLSNAVQNSWSNLNRTLDAAGTQLENTFVKALTPLTPALIEFSKSLNKAIATLMASPFVKTVIAGAGKGLETFAKYIGSDEFSKDLKSFIDELKKVGAAIKDTADFLHKIFGEDKTAMRSQTEAESIAQDRARLQRFQEERAGKVPPIGGQHLGALTPQRFDINVQMFDAAGNKQTAQAWATSAFGKIA